VLAGPAYPFANPSKYSRGKARRAWSSENVNKAMKKKKRRGKDIGQKGLVGGVCFRLWGGFQGLFDGRKRKKVVGRRNILKRKDFKINAGRGETKRSRPPTPFHT